MRTPVQVAILSLHRYQVDDTFTDRTGVVGTELSNVYDAILTDGKERLKCVVCPSQNDKIEKGAIRPRGIIRVVNSSFHYNVHESSLDPRAVFVLQEIEAVTASLSQWKHACNACGQEVVVSANNPRGQDAQILPILKQYTAESLVYRPIGAKRKYYLSEYDKSALPGPSMPCAMTEYNHGALQTTYDEFTNLWSSNREELVLRAGPDLQQLNPNPQLGPKIKTISEIPTGFSQEKGKQRLTMFVGRVMRKSNLRHFWKINSSGYPISAMLTLADSTGSVNVVLWNSTCARYLQALHVGDVVVVGNYRCKCNVFSGAKEIHLNSQKPDGVLRIIEENQAFSQELEHVQLESIDCLMQPKLVPQMSVEPQVAALGPPHQLEEDGGTGQRDTQEHMSCVGMLVDVSPIYVEKIPHREHTEKSQNHYREYRWITLADHTVLQRDRADRGQIAVVKLFRPTNVLMGNPHTVKAREPTQSAEEEKSRRFSDFSVLHDPRRSDFPMHNWTDLKAGVLCMVTSLVAVALSQKDEGGEDGGANNTVFALPPQEGSLPQGPFFLQSTAWTDIECGWGTVNARGVIGVKRRFELLGKTDDDGEEMCLRTMRREWGQFGGRTKMEARMYDDLSSTLFALKNDRMVRIADFVGTSTTAGEVESAEHLKKLHHIANSGTSVKKVQEESDELRLFESATFLVHAKIRLVRTEHQFAEQQPANSSSTTTTTTSSKRQSGKKRMLAELDDGLKNVSVSSAVQTRRSKPPRRFNPGEGNTTSQLEFNPRMDAVMGGNPPKNGASHKGFAKRGKGGGTKGKQQGKMPASSSRTTPPVSSAAAAVPPCALSVELVCINDANAKMQAVFWESDIYHRNIDGLLSKFAVALDVEVSATVLRPLSLVLAVLSPPMREALEAKWDSCAVQLQQDKNSSKSEHTNMVFNAVISTMEKTFDEWHLVCGVEVVRVSHCKVEVGVVSVFRSQNRNIQSAFSVLPGQ
jgi:hypothetical protein